MREVQLLDKHTLDIFYEKLTFIYLEMPRFQMKEEELGTRFEKWLYVLKNLPKLQRPPVKLQEKVFEKLFNEAELAKLTPEEMRTYEESLKVYRDNYAVIETAKNEGRQEGASEKAKEIARGMKQEGLSIELIATPQVANAIIAQEKADLAVVAREYLRNPYFATHAAGVLGQKPIVPFQYKRAYV